PAEDQPPLPAGRNPLRKGQTPIIMQTYGSLDRLMAWAVARGAGSGTGAAGSAGMMVGMIVYLHGFASSSGSYKAQLFLRRFAALGIEIVVPALDEGDFIHLTLSGQLRVVGRVCAGAAAAEPLVLIGSSMGGYLAALYAAAHPAAVDALVLMAPAVDFARRWRERLGEHAMAEWQA